MNDLNYQPALNTGAILDEIRRVELSMTKLPVLRWATVETDSPLSVRLDGDELPLDGTPSNSSGQNLYAGDRVHVSIQMGKVVVEGAAKVGGGGGGGGEGPPGRGITSVTAQYYQSTSATELAGGTWVTTPPAWAEDRYMWIKFVTTFTSGSPSETDPVSVSGQEGDPGAPGNPATNIITSVNSKTGVVVLNSTDVGALPAPATPTGNPVVQSRTTAGTYSPIPVSTTASANNVVRRDAAGGIALPASDPGALNAVSRNYVGSAITAALEAKIVVDPVSENTHPDGTVFLYTS